MNSEKTYNVQHVEDFVLMREYDNVKGVGLVKTHKCDKASIVEFIKQNSVQQYPPCYTGAYKENEQGCEGNPLWFSKCESCPFLEKE